MRHIAVVLNEKSGSSAGSTQAEILGACKRHGLTPSFVPIGKNFEEALGRLQKNKPFKTVVAAGGDGTVHAVANYAVKHGLNLAVIPVGTLNHFAKDTGLPLELEKAIQNIKRDQHRLVDVGQLGRLCFVNNSSVGLYPAMVRRRETLQKFITKWPAMLVALCVEAALLRRHRAELVIDGRRREHKVSFVFVGNNSYQLKNGSFERKAALSQGQLSVYVLKTAKFWPMLRVAWRAVRGRLVDESAFETYQAKSLTIHWPKQTTTVACDGEVLRLKTPLHYKIAPKSLRLIV